MGRSPRGLFARVPARPTPTPHPLTGSPVHAAALATLLAFLVRASWFLFVQQPGDALFSDMKGYIGRAANLLGGHDSLACFPPGTQYFYAAEMLVFGPAGLAAMGWVHALLGSATVGLWTLTAGHALRWRLAPAIVGGVLALWYPLVSFGGYFSSEQPYTFFLAVSLWLTVRLVRTGRGGLGVGIAAGIAAGIALWIRPPILLTVGLAAPWLWLRQGLRLRVVLAWLAPVVLALGLASARFYLVTGRAGLVSDNDAVASFFAWTDYREIKATGVQYADRFEGSGTFHPQPRQKRTGFNGTFQVNGDRCDRDVLLAERDRVIGESTVPQLLARARRDVRFLVSDNPMWPEATRAKEGWRASLLEGWDVLVRWVLVPLASMGLTTLLWWRNPALELVALHVATVVVAAALYTGDVRYRVPYDPVLVLLAVQAVGVAAGRERLSAWQTPRGALVVFTGLLLTALLVFLPWRAM